MNHEPTTSHNMIVWLENLSSKVSLEKKGPIWVNCYIIPKLNLNVSQILGGLIPLYFSLYHLGEKQNPTGFWISVAFLATLRDGCADPLR